MGEIEFIPVELPDEIYNLKIKQLVEVLLEIYDEIESSSETPNQKEVA